LEKVIGSLLSNGVSLPNRASILIEGVAVTDRPDSANVSVLKLLVLIILEKRKAV
jgi:hypothetical protein